MLPRAALAMGRYPIAAAASASATRCGGCAANANARPAGVILCARQRSALAAAAHNPSPLLAMALAQAVELHQSLLATPDTPVKASPKRGRKKKVGESFEPEPLASARIAIDNSPAKPAKKSQAPKKESQKQKQTKAAALDVSLATDEPASLLDTVTAGPRMESQPQPPAAKAQPGKAPKKKSQQQKKTKIAAPDVSFATDEPASLHDTPVGVGPSISPSDEIDPQAPAVMAQPRKLFYFRVSHIPRTALKDDVVNLFKELPVLHGMGRVCACHFTVLAKRGVRNRVAGVSDTMVIK